MTDDARIDDILAKWRAGIDAGRRQDPEDLIREHPDLAEELRRRFAALAVLDRLLEQPLLRESLPRRLDDYRILREIGRGGMGVVYEAEQASMRRRVALKVLYPRITTSRRTVARFQREARAAGRLHHTNIVPVYELGREGGTWFFAMELVEGASLEAIITGLRQGAEVKAPGADDASTKQEAPEDHAAETSSSLGSSAEGGAWYRRVSRLFADVAGGLEHAHAAGIVHRDIKPSNLILDVSGALKIIDFGLAGMEEDPASVTASGDRLGTPLYMSPEQLRGDPVDQRCDVFGLGATLYELLTQRTPFPARRRPVPATHRDPLPLRRIDPHIPRDLENIVLKALEEDARRRYATAALMAADLRRFAEGSTVAARPVGPAVRTWRRVRRHPAISLLVLSVLVLGIVAGVLGVRAREGAREARDLRYLLLCMRAEEALARTSFSEGDELLTPGEPPAALLGEAIALDPDRPEAWLSRVFVSERTAAERLADAEAAHARGLSLRTCILAQAFVRRLEGRVEESRHLLEGARGLPGAGPLDALLEGRLLLAQGLTREGIAKLGEAIDQAPLRGYGRVVALFLRSRAHEKNGDLAAAIEDLSALRASGPLDMSLRIRIASLWRRLGKSERATALFEEALAETRQRGDADAWLAFCRACPADIDPGWKLRGTTAAQAAGFRTTPILLAHAEALDGSGRAEEGAALCREILSREPQNLAATLSLANRLMTLDLPAEALPLYDRCLARGAADQALVIHTNRGVVLTRLGRMDEALAAFQRAVEVDPASALPATNLAQALGNLERWEESLAAADRALLIEPKGLKALRVRAIALAMLGRLEDAVTEFRRRRALGPMPADLHHDLGEALLRLRRHEEALAAYDEGLAVERDHLPCLVGRGTTLVELGRPEEALEVSARIEELAPEDARGPAARARALLRMGRHDEVVAAARRALKLDSACESASATLAAALNGLGRYAEAVEAIDRHLAVHEDCAPGWRLRAEARFALGRDEEALQAIERAIALDPGHIIDRSRRAACLLRLGRTDEALAAYEALGRDDPTDAEPHMLVGYILFVRRRFSEATQAFQRGLKRDPQWPKNDPRGTNHLFSLAQALLMTGKTAEALSVADRLLAGGGPEGSLQVLRTLCLAQLGRTDEATRAEKAALDAARLPDGGRALLVEALRLQGRHEQELRLAQRLTRRKPKQWGHLEVASLRALGRNEDARDLAEAWRTCDPPLHQALPMAYLHAAAGDRDAMWAALQRYTGTWDAAVAHERARIHAVAGEHDTAFEWLRRAITAGYRRPAAAGLDPDLQPLAEFPAVQELLPVLFGTAPAADPGAGRSPAPPRIH